MSVLSLPQPELVRRDAKEAEDEGRRQVDAGQLKAEHEA
jgi:hypothetical protein